MDIQPIDVSYHRNGVAGQGFYTVIFNLTEDGVTRKMLGTLFGSTDPESGTFEYRRDCLTAVVCIDDLVQTEAQTGLGGIQAWRGDNFHGYLWDAISEWEKGHDARLEEAAKSFKLAPEFQAAVDRHEAGVEA